MKKATRHQGNQAPRPATLVLRGLGLRTLDFAICDPADAPPEFSPEVVAALYPLVAHLRSGRALRFQFQGLGHDDRNCLPEWVNSAERFFDRLGIRTYSHLDFDCERPMSGPLTYWIVPLSATATLDLGPETLNSIPAGAVPADCCAAARPGERTCRADSC